MSLYEVLDGFAVPKVRKGKYVVLDDVDFVIFHGIDHIAFSGKDVENHIFGVNVPRGWDNEKDYNELLRKMVKDGFSAYLSHLIVISEDQYNIDNSAIYHALADSVDPENVTFFINPLVRYYPIKVNSTMEIEILKKRSTF